jgi:hypothetical protein
MADKVENEAASGQGRAAKPSRETPKPVRAGSRRKAETPTLTDDLTGKFLRVGDKLYRTSDDKSPIVKLEPDRLKTSNIDALPDIVRIAKANGWTSIRLNGGDTFRKAAFLAATAQGLTVENYTPSKLVQAEADRLHARLAERAQRRQGKAPAGKHRTIEEDVTLTALSDRFLRQTHEQNAADPELRRAQSLVAQAIAIARAKYPDDPAKASMDVEAKRQEIARRIATGDKIAAIKIRSEQTQRVREVRQGQAMNRDGRSR